MTGVVLVAVVVRRVGDVCRFGAAVIWFYEPRPASRPAWRASLRDGLRLSLSLDPTLVRQTGSAIEEGFRHNAIGLR